jgi:hypothetical protein
VDDVSTGSNSYSYYVRSYLNVTVQNTLGSPVSGASVTATATGGGSEIVNQVTDASGNVQLVLTDHSAASASGAHPAITAYTPHTITVTKSGCANFSTSLQVTQSMTLPVSLSCPKLARIVHLRHCFRFHHSRWLLKAISETIRSRMAATQFLLGCCRFKERAIELPAALGRN